MLRDGLGKLARRNQAVESRDGFDDRRHSGGIILRALFGGVAERKDLFFPSCSGQHRGYPRISAFIKPRIGFRMDEDPPSFGKQTLNVFNLVRRNGVREQRGARSCESPSVVAPGIHPLATVAKRRVLANPFMAPSAPCFTSCNL